MSALIIHVSDKFQAAQYILFGIPLLKYCEGCFVFKVGSQSPLPRNLSVNDRAIPAIVDLLERVIHNCDEV